MTYGGVDHGRRRFLTATTSVVGAVGAAYAAVPFVTSWQPSARAKAIGAPITVDYSKIEPGQLIVQKWRGKPVWILRRTEAALASLDAVAEQLRDAGSEEDQQPAYARNKHRSRRPELLILVGLCTHLGCAPSMVRPAEAGQFNLGSDWQGGFFCPCHGSKFDFAGRVYNSVPAPTNLQVPPHRFEGEHLLIIGEDEGGIA
ncbi:MAG: ubiquinol-cytochrome c reductase iron-sulfur subunit [Gammaproteobacteria bacterium]|nr:ubiquinol-cytochrome c reductase iron-sulfur subunit [Gammaproteobacteria bacterium]